MKVKIEVLPLRSQERKAVIEWRKGYESVKG